MKTYLELDSDGRVYSCNSSPVSEGNVEIDANLEDEIWRSPLSFIYQNGQLIKDESYLLQEIKKNKDLELNRACNKTINGPFIATVNDIDYAFSNDSEAQSNFEKADRAFEKGRITEIGWTAYNSDGEVIRLLLTSELFEPVYLAHLNHIQNNIAKYRDILMPQVLAAQSKLEIETIQWDQ